MKPRIVMEQDQITGVKQCQDDENVESLSLPKPRMGIGLSLEIDPGKHNE